ncbi:MAG: hypothetical protein ACR2O6_04635, partial [Ilumatobacteraceae bacterium]
MGDTAEDERAAVEGPIGLVEHPSSPARNIGTELVATTILMLLGPGVLVLSDTGTLGASVVFGVGLALA